MVLQQVKNADSPGWDRSRPSTRQGNQDIAAESPRTSFPYRTGSGASRYLSRPGNNPASRQGSGIKAGMSSTGPSRTTSGGKAFTSTSSTVPSSLKVGSSPVQSWQRSLSGRSDLDALTPISPRTEREMGWNTSTKVVRKDDDDQLTPQVTSRSSLTAKELQAQLPAFTSSPSARRSVRGSAYASLSTSKSRLSGSGEQMAAEPDQNAAGIAEQPELGPMSKKPCSAELHTPSPPAPASHGDSKMHGPTSVQEHSFARANADNAASAPPPSNADVRPEAEVQATSGPRDNALSALMQHRLPSLSRSLSLPTVPEQQENQPEQVPDVSGSTAHPESPSAEAAPAAAPHTAASPVPEDRAGPLVSSHIRNAQEQELKESISSTGLPLDKNPDHGISTPAGMDGIPASGTKQGQDPMVVDESHLQPGMHLSSRQAAATAPQADPQHPTGIEKAQGSPADVAPLSADDAGHHRTTGPAVKQQLRETSETSSGLNLLQAPADVLEQPETAAQHSRVASHDATEPAAVVQPEASGAEASLGASVPMPVVTLPLDSAKTAALLANLPAPPGSAGQQPPSPRLASGPPPAEYASAVPMQTEPTSIAARLAAVVRPQSEGASTGAFDASSAAKPAGTVPSHQAAASKAAASYGQPAAGPSFPGASGGKLPGGMPGVPAAPGSAGKQTPQPALQQAASGAQEGNGRKRKIGQAILCCFVPQVKTDPASQGAFEDVQPSRASKSKQRAQGAPKMKQKLASQASGIKDMSAAMMSKLRGKGPAGPQDGSAPALHVPAETLAGVADDDRSSHPREMAPTSPAEASPQEPATGSWQISSSLSEAMPEGQAMSIALTSPGAAKRIPASPPSPRRSFDRIPSRLGPSGSQRSSDALPTQLDSATSIVPQQPPSLAPIAKMVSVGKNGLLGAVKPLSGLHHKVLTRSTSKEGYEEELAKDESPIPDVAHLGAGRLPQSLHYEIQK